MTRARQTIACLAALASTVALAGCREEAVREPTPSARSGSASAGAEPHTHPDGGHGLPPVGDGTRRTEVGYSLDDVRLPARAGEPGTLSFVVRDYRGRPQTGFLSEQTKRIHVYVVRDDLAVFRHVHPTMRPDGVWTGRLTLPEPGDYRVVTELTARDEGGNGDFVMLGAPATVPGRWQPRPPPAPTGSAADWGVEAEVVGQVAGGAEGELRLRLTGPDGAEPRVGRYLGVPAHLTGFHVPTGGAVHLHPMGEPATVDEAVELTFHTRLLRPGHYLLFLQVQVDDFLHTLPLSVRTS